MKDVLHHLVLLALNHAGIAALIKAGNDLSFGDCAIGLILDAQEP